MTSRPPRFAAPRHIRSDEVGVRMRESNHGSPLIAEMTHVYETRRTRGLVR
jgi:hypothetical protein